VTRLYEWWIGVRYLSSTHRRGFISFVALVSMIGLTLGVAVLIVVLSVMNGFERELRTRMLAVTSHATLMGLEHALDDWPKAQAAALETPGVRAAVPYIEAQAMFERGGRITGAQVRGVDPAVEPPGEGLASRVIEGDLATLEPGAWNIVLGDALARELGAGIGDSVVLIATEASATPGGVVPRMRRFTVSGIFSSGMYEFDRGLALIALRDAQRIYRLGDRVTGIRLTLDDAFRAPRTVRDVAIALGGGFFVSDWTRNHANFFRSIEITKSMMFMVLVTIVGVAAFNIIATLVMIVKEKQTDIAILRTLGASPRNVLAAFTVQGVLIGLAGTTLGATIGWLLSRNLESLVHGLERLLGTQFLDAKVYYMSDLPAHVEWSDVLQVCGVAFALCAVATLYPAWRAARTAPAEALRHE
jgi:lipoprotein-releasing system permease protein